MQLTYCTNLRTISCVILSLNSDMLYSIMKSLKGVVHLPISFDKVKAVMEAKGLKKYDLRKAGINGSILDKVLSGSLNTHKRVDTNTIDKLCAFLNCQPGDIMEYVEDE